MEDVAALVATEQFDVVRNALDVYAELFRRFYEDPERRKRIKERVRESWDLMPLFIRVELLADLAEIALAHEDQAETLALIDEARGIMESAQWPPYAEVTLVARLAALRFAAGDEQVAVQELERALVLFDAEKRRIVDIDRAETLRPIAEAYHRMGRDDAALEIYRRALEAGMENPNSRPRAEDLVDTCCSLAVHAVEPGRELMERIREVRDALGDPW
jgi:tetratricopeptide (TPR) repeat protein